MKVYRSLVCSRCHIEYRDVVTDNNSDHSGWICGNCEGGKTRYYFAVFINADFHKINFFNTFIDQHPIEVMIELVEKNKSLTLLSWQEVDESTYLKYQNCKAITYINQ